MMVQVFPAVSLSEWFPTFRKGDRTFISRTIEHSYHGRSNLHITDDRTFISRTIKPSYHGRSNLQITDDRNFISRIRSPRRKTLTNEGTSVTTHPTTRRHILQEPNPQQRRYYNARRRKFPFTSQILGSP